MMVNLNSKDVLLQGRLNEIRQWAESRHLSDGLLKRLKIYTTTEFEECGEFDEKQLLSTMYPSLRVELMHHILADCLFKVRFFVSCDSTFLSRILCSLVSVTVNSEEAIARSGDWQYELFFLLSGKAFVEGTQIRKISADKEPAFEAGSHAEQRSERRSVHDLGAAEESGSREAEANSNSRVSPPKLSVRIEGDVGGNQEDAGVGSSSGSAMASKRDRQTSIAPVILAYLEDGAFFSSEILQGGAVSQVVACSLCDLFVLHRDALLGILETYPHYAQQIVQLKRWRAKDEMFSESDDKLRSMPLATPGAPRGTAPPAVSLAPAHHVLSTGESGLAARKHIVTPQPAMAVGQGTIAGQVAADGPLQPVPRAHDEESSSNEI